MDETLLQFGHRAEGGAEQPGRVQRRDATSCPRCAQQFSPDGRFCPFDGEPLRKVAPRDSGDDPLLGTVVDQRYEICALLGEGGMGVVYEVCHRALGKRFALKALRKELASDPEIAARFLQEARTAASVSHPGLVEIIDFGRLPGGQPFFVMALLEGQSLASLIRRGGPIPAARAVDFVLQIAEALGHAHDLSIVHRDLKPDNIHLSADDLGRDRVTIVDFGLAKVVGASRLTRAGMVFGTPHYMSPEQALGEPTDHRADIYALGIVMYEMFTGRVPFEADSYMGVLTKQMYMTPTPPSELLGGTSQLGALEDVCLRCLEKKPEHRYASLRELSQDLELAMSASGARPSATRKRRATPRSVLADELELPSRDELKLRLNGRRLQQWPKWPLAVVTAFFLVGMGSMLALRQRSTGGRTKVALAPSPGRAEPGRPGAAAVSGVHVVAAPSTERPAELSPAELAAGDGPLRAETSAAPPRSPARPAARVVALRPGSAPAKQRARLGGSSEIVDPWAR